MPVETCYRILDVLTWVTLVAGSTALGLVYARGPGLVGANPIYWTLCGLQGLLFLSGIFRGWPFSVRTGIVMLTVFGITVGGSIEIGLSPNWSVFLLFLTFTSSLFFGVRAGLGTVLVLGLVMLAVAWGWVTGRLPLFLPKDGSAQRFLDYRSPLVWTRVLVTGACLQAGIVLLMRYVLGNLNDALKQANQMLHKLAVEQEYRARAEEARLRAELAVREAQKFEALGRLASGVAHDFNNALCVVKGWSSLLLEEAREPVVQEAMRDIKRAGENAEQLTQHLLAFSRGDPVKSEVVDVSAAVELESRTLRRLLPSNVQVSTQLAGVLPVRLGQGQLQEVLLNLAINARDAMPQGGSLAISAAEETTAESAPGRSAGRYARVEVADTGVGMDAATQARIFEPFFSTKAPGKGTGLGLAMVYGVVTGAGGWVAVESRVGQGTRFIIHLPLVDSTIPTPAPAVNRILNQRRCRVLVVETQPEIRSLVERILAREGFPVVTAEDGARALAVLAAPGSFGLLLVEATLAGAQAGTVIRRALERESACRVIVTATQVPDEALQEAIRSGCYSRLTKPFDAGQLREAVNVALAQSPAVRDTVA